MLYSHLPTVDGWQAVFNMHAHSLVLSTDLFSPVYLNSIFFLECGPEKCLSHLFYLHALIHPQMIYLLFTSLAIATHKVISKLETVQKWEAKCKLRGSR